MATKTIESELLGLEKRYWQAVKDKDIDAAMRLTDDPCIVAGARGIARVDRQKFMAIMKGAPYTLHEFEIKDDAEVRLLGDDVAILAYNVHEELTVEGKPVTLDAADSSVWVRREGRWVCALHTESIAGDSYGRDRRPVK
jgi:ketosteroid isomerase-like protein